MNTETDGKSAYSSAVMHLLVLTGPPGVVPLWLFRAKKTGEVRYHATEALNFLITYILIMATVCIVWPTPIPLWLAAFFAVAIIALVIVACRAAQRGARFRYPLTLRILK